MKCSEVKYTLNPYTATAVLRLADSRTWRFRADFDAMVVMCTVLKRTLSELVSTELSLDVLKLWVYAGVARSALAQGEDWSLERAAQLVTSDQYADIAPRVSEAITLALFGPEPPVEPVADAEEEKPQGESRPWDWRAAQHAAVSVLDISLEEFWTMTLWEFQLRSAARYEGIKQDRLAAANLTANLMNCWLKRPITGKQLLGISEGSSSTSKGFAEMGQLEKEAALEQVRQNILNRVKAGDVEQESSAS